MTSPECPALRAPAFSANRWLGLIARLLLAFCIAWATATVPAYAQDGKQPADEINKTLDTIRAQIDQLHKDLEVDPDKPQQDAELVKLRDTARKASEDAQTAVTVLEPILTSVQARLTELGEPVEGITEGPDVATQRKELSRRVSSLDAQIKLGRLIQVEAEQANARIMQLRRAHFQAELGERSGSVLGESFWTELRTQLPRDIKSLQPIWQELSAAIQAHDSRVWLTVLLAIAALSFLR